MLSLLPPAALAALCGAAGLLTGYRLFPLAARDPRTVLPSAWRWPMAIFTGVFCAAAALRAHTAGELLLYLLLPVFGVLLAAIDLRSKLLPNALMLPFLGATAAALLIAAAGGAGWGGLLAAGAGGLSMFAFYLVLALISPAGMGMGDVKLSGVLGLIGGYAGFTAWMATLLGGFLFGGLAGIVLLLSRRGGRGSVFPFGPGMVVAALIGVLAFSG